MPSLIMQLFNDSIPMLVIDENEFKNSVVSSSIPPSFYSRIDHSTVSKLALLFVEGRGNRWIQSA